MQSTGQGCEKRSYRIILLLIVGLAALSSAMHELNRAHELTLQTGRLVAEWTGNLPGRKAPEIPNVPELPHLPNAPAVSEKKVIRIVHLQKRDGKQCPISSSLQ